VSPTAYIFSGIAILLLVPALRSAQRHWKNHEHKHGFWYEVSKDFVGPLMFAALGFYFGSRLDQQRVAIAENQGKSTILREMVTKGNGPDVAFFTAVGERLTVHLQHYEKLREAQAGDAGGEEMERKMLFDERAIYFYYGMFRVAVVDFLATKGFVLYPRVWMEEAFEGLTNHVVDHFIGCKERMDDFPEEQAALYRYFGASKATYHAGSKRPDEPIPDLFQFSLMLADTRDSVAEKSPYYPPQVIELQKGFQRFQRRLHARTIVSKEIIVTFEAMIGLDDYAFNTLFSTWYGQFETAVSVKICPEHPRDFLPYPLRNFEPSAPEQEKVEWAQERNRAWTLVFNSVPVDLRKTAKEEKAECARR
jgi:hypothetical protein